MKRQKFENARLLRAKEFKDGDTVIATGFIKSVADVHTKFNEEGETSTKITISDEKSGETVAVFANVTSMNNLIEAFGDDDKHWIDESVKVVCNKENYLENLQLVIEPLTKSK